MDSQTINLIWKCAGCVHCRPIKCGECGHEKIGLSHCSRLNIDVENDFYCKYWFGIYNSTGTYYPTNGTYQWTYTVSANPSNTVNYQ